MLIVIKLRAHPTPTVGLVHLSSPGSGVPVQIIYFIAVKSFRFDEAVYGVQPGRVNTFWERLSNL